MPFFKSRAIQTFKQDIAPIGFYFDIFSTTLFQIPVLPIPLRIDKVLRGEPCLLIIPNKGKMERLSRKFGIHIDYSLFYKIGIKNLLNYARSKREEITKKNHLDSIILRNWWDSSNCISTTNPDLMESFTFINFQFLKTYSSIESTNIDTTLHPDNYKDKLIEYCESIINYFRNKIERNLFFTKNDEGKYKLEKLYLERRKKYFPLEIEIPIHNLKTDKTTNMKFVPYLIYDDLLDCFSYNKKLLMNGDIPINLKVYEDNKIINKTSTNDEIRTISSKIELEKLNLEEILEKY